MTSFPTKVARRDFLRAGASAGIALGLDPGVRWLVDPDQAVPEIIRNSGVRRGQAQHLTILHTSDIHGQLEVHDEFFWEDGRAVFKQRGGFATLRTLIDSIRKEARGTVLLVDGGDTLHGSAVAALSEGRAIVPLINRLGYDLLLPGNWEVVYGKSAMLRDFRMYSAAKVCANMFHADGQHLLFPPYQIFNLGGTRVGFIGYTDPFTGTRQSPDYSRGIRFAPPEASLARYVKLLKEDRGCALVCVLSHLGLAQQLHLADQESARGVDYVLGGDTHERTREPLQGRFARVTEPGAFGSFIGRLDLVLENGRVTEESYRLLEVDPERYPADGEMRTLVAAAKAPYQSQLSRVIGRTTTPLLRYYVLETPLDNLITDALFWRFRTDFVVSNGFRFCPPLVPGPDGSAAITMEYLWSALPVDSDVKTAAVTGAQIRDWLERELENVFAEDAADRFGGWFVRYKGMQVTFRIKAPTGTRVQEVAIGGRPLEPGKVYSMLACEREGDPDNVLCRMKGVSKPRRRSVRLHEVLVEYLAKFSPVSPDIEGRAVALDAPGRLLSQVEGTSYRFR
ncbi:MAG TPA: bifunctional metallophosphatase/5'-nucleotidase [Gemmatimonadales bacterium]|nr:bifunctional metallophosphatase/5'-nucleotidase [Gemmatimonadales bacterium]